MTQTRPPRPLTQEDHRIEESAKVYLTLGPHGWEIDPINLREPLDSSEHGPYHEAGVCGCSDRFRAEGDELCEWAMRQVAVPTAMELLLMLSDALGYRVVPRSTT